MRLPFNSTRYIRNQAEGGRSLYRFWLSTPHGTLGTYKLTKGLVEKILLSTPHGTLGTLDTKLDPVQRKPFPSFNSTRYIRNKSFNASSKFLRRSFNSTRYIRNGRVRIDLDSKARLSTPHGTLGTFG